MSTSANASRFALSRFMSRPMSRDKSDTLLLLVSCVLVLAPHASHLPAWVSGMCGLLLFWRGWITFRGNRMPPTWVLMPIALLAMGAVYWEFKRVFGKDPGVAMLVMLITFKMLEMHAKRDLFAVIFVSYFIMLTNFLYSQSIPTALTMVAAVIAILTTQLSFQYTGTVPPLRKRLAFGAGIFGLAIPLTLVLFVLFPRIQGPLWGMPTDAGSARSGLSETMSPNNISNLVESDEVAFRVKFIDPPPPKASLYWRAVVMGRYDGKVWSQLPRQRMARQNIEIESRGTPIRHQVTLEPNGRRWLFALEMPNELPRLTGNNVSISSEMQMLASEPINSRVRYDVSSYVNFNLQTNEHPSVLRQSLQLPAGFNPRTVAFAAQLRSQFPENVAAVNAVLKFFREEKFSYTLQPPTLNEQAIDEFLFTTRAGFCEHYSGAFVVLMRALGIPARVVTGYQGGEINPVDGFMTVRQSDAHAWAEVWLENRGWVRVDPTAAVAPERVEQNLNSILPRPAFGGLINLGPGATSWISRLRVNYDAMNNAWNQWVLSYTPDKQKSFIESLGFENVDWRTLIALLLVFGSAVLAITMLPLLMQRKKVAPLDATYAALCREMARHGMARATHEGPRTYRERLTSGASALEAEKKAAVGRFLQLYETLKYGAAGQSEYAIGVSQLKSLLTECK